MTQIASPNNVYLSVHGSSDYHGAADRSNEQDTIFSDCLNQNLADSILGNNTDGGILLKTITVA